MIGKPSAQLAAKIDADEKQRLDSRREALGPARLAELQKAVEEAKAESEKAPPPEMIRDFPITDVGVFR